MPLQCGLVMRRDPLSGRRSGNEFGTDKMIQGMMPCQDAPGRGGSEGGGLEGRVTVNNNCSCSSNFYYCVQK